MKVRRADLAGSWYPARGSDCRKAIEGFMDASLSCPGNGGKVVGGIVPHAGWMFSGKIACNVIKCLHGQDGPETCILFGRHLHTGSANFIMTEGRWDTPLGELAIDSDLATELAGEFVFSIETSSQYDDDNTIEVQLPFLRYFYPDIKIVPMGLPPHSDSLEIAKKAIEISRRMGRKTVVLGSTDLTHYGYDYGFMPRGAGEEAVRWVTQINDKRAINLMVKMDEHAIMYASFKDRNICCPGAVAAAIVAARELGAVQAQQMIYGTSYDVRQDSSFVGYAGIVFTGSYAG
jgi:AmmeMemoRadiSam system protein B